MNINLRSCLPRRDETYSTDELDLLSSGSGSEIAFWETVIEVLSKVFIDPLYGRYVQYILDRGIKTDVFDPLPDIDVLDPTGGVLNVPVQQIVPGAGVILDDDQKYPITGWLEAFWATPIA